MKSKRHYHEAVPPSRPATDADLARKRAMARAAQDRRRALVAEEKKFFRLKLKPDLIAAAIYVAAHNRDRKLGEHEVCEKVEHKVREEALAELISKGCMDIVVGCVLRARTSAVPEWIVDECKVIMAGLGKSVIDDCRKRIALGNFLNIESLLRVAHANASTHVQAKK